MLKLKIYRSDIEFFLFTAIFRIVLDWNYARIVSVLYRYVGFTSNPNAATVTVSWVILFAISAVAAKYYRDSVHLSAKVYLLLFLFSTVPFTTMVAYNCCTISFVICNSIYYFVLFLSYYILSRFGISRLRFFFGLNKRIVSDNVIVAITIVLALTLLYVSGRYTHFRFNFRLDNVYDLRAEATTYHLPRVLSYLHSWARALIPVCLAVYLKKNNALMIAVCILAELLSFGIDGSKSPLLMSICVIAIFFCPKKIAEKTSKYILIGLIVIMSASLLQYLIFGEYSLCALITRRSFFVPMNLETCYFDFFSDKVPDFFRGSFLRHFGFQTPYPNLDNIIGAVYFNAPLMNCNNGLLSDAISNLGYVGILIMPCLIAAVMIILDECTKGVDPRIYLATSLFVAIGLTNTFLLTALLSHGILVLIILLANVEKEDNVGQEQYCLKGDFFEE